MKLSVQQLNCLYWSRDNAGALPPRDGVLRVGGYMRMVRHLVANGYLKPKHPHQISEKGRALLQYTSRGYAS